MVKVLVAGVGMTPFLKPSQTNPPYFQLAASAVRRALRDCNLQYEDIQQAIVGFIYQESTAGQRALYEVGMTGIPIYNVNNYGCTGATALILAKTLIESGRAHCVLVLGFDKMEPGELQLWPINKSSTDQLSKRFDELAEPTNEPLLPKLWAHASREHMAKYGTTPEHFAKIALKSHLHSTLNPYAQFRSEYSLEQIQSSRMICPPLTKLQCSPTSDGAAAAIICSEEFAAKHGLLNQSVEILSYVLRTNFPSTYQEDSVIKLIGYDMTKAAAAEAFREAGLTPREVNIAEVYDCFASNELLSYEAIGFCEEGKAGEFIDKGLNTYGGQVVVNPSGGLISRGHPIGATGLGQCVELMWHLRAMAGVRQVPNAKIALQHTMGLQGAAAVGLYKKYNDQYIPRHDQSSDPQVLEANELKPKL